MNTMTDAYGISDQLTALIERHGAEAVADEMPDQWLEDLTLVGTPAEVVVKMRRWLEGGVDSVCIFWTPDPEPGGQRPSGMWRAGDQRVGREDFTAAFRTSGARRPPS